MRYSSAPVGTGILMSRAVPPPTTHTSPTPRSISTATELLFTPFDITYKGPVFAFAGTTTRSSVSDAENGTTFASVLLKKTVLLVAGVANLLPATSSVSPTASELSLKDAIFGTTTWTSVESSDPHDASEQRDGDRDHGREPRERPKRRSKRL